MPSLCPARIIWIASAISLALCLPGCAEKKSPPAAFQRDSAPVQRPVTLPEFVTNAPAAHKAMTLKVPLILQKDNYSSGPTSLAMVMGYYDVLPYDKKEVWKRSGTTFKQVLRECGNDMAGLERAARSYGFSHMEFMENANLETIKSLLDQGIAPIANVRSFHSEKPDTYASLVVAGYSPSAFLLHDPTKGIYQIPQKKFMDNWQAPLCSPNKGMAMRSLFVLYPREK